MIQPGRRANLDFLLKVVLDGQQQEVRFADLLRRRTIVSVYMRNNTSACDRQVASLAAHAEDFARSGYDLIAVSRDSCASHLKYAAKQGVRFILASDPDDLVSAAMDAMVEKSMYGKKYIGPARAAYVLDPDGTVLALAEKVDTGDHAAQVRELLSGLP